MLTPEKVQDIAVSAESMGIGEAAVAILRQSYPGVHITYCVDDDLPNQVPVLSRVDFNVYLVDGREHCLRLTGDYEAATGLVIAEKVDDSD
jgi:hypothetical protein